MILPYKEYKVSLTTELLKWKICINFKSIEIGGKESDPFLIIHSSLQLHLLCLCAKMSEAILLLYLHFGNMTALKIFLKTTT